MSKAEINGRPITLLGISGSLRRGSYNTQLLNALTLALGTRVQIDVFALNDVPLYNEDLETASLPAAVQSLRDCIGAADGIIIACPEYNHGIPGVLKNALDWASRPNGASTLTKKPVLTFSASPAFTGGVRAQSQLNETLTAIAAQLVLRPQLVIGAVHKQLVDGKVTNESTLEHLCAGVEDLITHIKRSAFIAKQES